MSETTLRNALFIDLDDTLIETKSGNQYPKDYTDWKFTRNVLKKITRYCEYNPLDPVIIVTNQTDIATGYITDDEFRLKLEEVKRALKQHIDPPLLVSYYNTTLKGFDMMSKPNPGMAYLAALNHNINLQGSTMIGDRYRDEVFAKTAGMKEFIKATTWLH